MLITERLAFLASHISHHTESMLVKEIVSAYLANDWSEDFVRSHKFDEENPEDFYIQGGGVNKMFVISEEGPCNLQKKEGKMKKVPLDAIATLTDYLWYCLKKQSFIGVAINSDSGIEHHFVLFLEEDKIWIADAYNEIRSLSVRPFDFPRLYRLLYSPSTEKWNEIFGCEETLTFGYPIHFEFSLRNRGGEVDHKYDTIAW